MSASAARSVVAEVRRLTPRRNEMDARAALAQALELAAVDVYARAAAVDLAGAERHQRERGRREPGLLGRGVELLERPERTGGVSAGFSILACVIVFLVVVTVGLSTHQPWQPRAHPSMGKNLYPAEPRVVRAGCSLRAGARMAPDHHARSRPARSFASRRRLASRPVRGKAVGLVRKVNSNGMRTRLFIWWLCSDAGLACRHAPQLAGVPRAPSATE